MYFTRLANQLTFTTRLLYTVIPSENYAPKGQTLDCLLSALADDLSHLSRYSGHGLDLATCPFKKCCFIQSLKHLSFEPVKVTWQKHSFKLYTTFIGTKGDWPWLRSSYNLATGFTANRICVVGVISTLCLGGLALQCPEQNCILASLGLA